MTELPDYGVPFIFANFNGTSGDVDVITHECGHAFQSYVSCKDPITDHSRYLTMETAEIHSMSMEFFAEPWIELFFGERGDDYRKMHLEDAIDFIPYGTMVDEFQHIMYQQPDLTPDERNAVWLELEKKYRPWNKFGDLPFYGRGAGWQRQLHIFECPFYYIDYCLATAIALQFFVASLKDHKDAWQRYMKLTNLAGMATYTELAESAGMKAPFTKGSLTELSRAVADWIEQHQVS
jgi:M3 family oligoendopeptidase